MDGMDNASYQDFKAATGEFFRITKRENITLASADDGYKCLGIIYLNRLDNWSDLDLYQAELILRMATKRVVEIEVREAA